MLQDDMATDGTGYGRNKLHDRLMRHTHGVFQDAAPENFRSDSLLFGKSFVETIDQNVGVNESGHVCKDPLYAIPCLENAWPGVPANAEGVLLPDQTNGVSSPGLPLRLVFPEE